MHQSRVFLFYCILFQLAAYSCQHSPSKKRKFTHVCEFSFSGTSIRAIVPISKSEIWFAGNNGIVGSSQNGGQTWQLDTLYHQNIALDIRSLTANKNGDLFLTSTQPAILFKFQKKSLQWAPILHDTQTNAFFNAVTFMNDSVGFVLGDPLHGQFMVYQTTNNGLNWSLISSGTLPRPLADEYPFAASNSNFTYDETHIYFGTGGQTAARVISSDNQGKTWNSYSTRMVSGKNMTGIYSIHLAHDSTLLIAGGDWDHPSQSEKNLNISTDFGKTWKNIPNTLGFLSCVKSIYVNNELQILALSGRIKDTNTTLYLLNEQGDILCQQTLSGVVSIYPLKKEIWYSGKNKIGKIILE